MKNIIRGSIVFVTFFIFIVAIRIDGNKILAPAECDVISSDNPEESIFVCNEKYDEYIYFDEYLEGVVTRRIQSVYRMTVKQKESK